MERTAAKDKLRARQHSYFPVCDPCFEQLGKERSAGTRVAHRFDRSGQRVRNAQTAPRHEAQVAHVRQQIQPRQQRQTPMSTAPSVSAGNKRRREIVVDSDVDDVDGEEGEDGVED